ncbi:hypothetical protein AMATHDRAFT_59576 [Amanita thiersii Skay4041]|uniref:Sugar phosphate transporter domain-containing protein n=1 Tax=Amanita thiersii Skay4041 TaxID=703135 RepID=A0A2A9NS27_9AGAR|nr:hypothetical protein AMATHDRAFT_59576 [Amanita thiersii Skay4041]
MKSTKLYSSKLRYPGPPLNDLKRSSAPTDIRSRARRALRISSHHRICYDRHTSPVSSPASYPSPLPNDFTLPPFPSPITASGSTSKLRAHQRWSWRPLLAVLDNSPIFWLVMYFLFNLSLTLFNKSVLINFPFPYSLTALHALCTTVGSSFVLRSHNPPVSGGKYPNPWATLNWKEIFVVLAFSILFTINIAMSNISLDLVTVPFHQVVRASTPLFTILWSKFLLGSKSSRPKLISLIPVIAGVGFATYGDYYFTLWGFFLTLLGTVLAALKTVVTNILQSPSDCEDSTFVSRPLKLSTILNQFFHPRPALPRLSPLEHLHLLSPLACIQSIFLAYMTGELSKMCHFVLHHCSYLQRSLFIMNGMLAFGLNVTSFGANKRVGAVAMSVAANVKQVLTVVCAVAVFNLNMSPTNAVGIALTLCGGAWYTVVELREKKRAKFIQESGTSNAAIRMGAMNRHNNEKLNLIPA